MENHNDKKNEVEIIASPKSNASLNKKREEEISSEDLEGFEVPQMNVSIPETTLAPNPADTTHLISDDKYLGVIDEIMTSLREERKQVSDYVDTFADMVINDGDASTSTKEAFVNLVKIKVDLQDKFLKALGEMTKLKIKNAYAYSGPHLNALQQNNFNINQPETPDFNRKELIRAINHAKKKKE